jgi:hypothetical protein
MLGVFILSVVMLSVVILKVVMLCGVILNVVMLSVLAPYTAALDSHHCLIDWFGTRRGTSQKKTLQNLFRNIMFYFHSIKLQNQHQIKRN